MYQWYYSHRLFAVEEERGLPRSGEHVITELSSSIFPAM